MSPVGVHMSPACRSTAALELSWTCLYTVLKRMKSEFPPYFFVGSGYFHKSSTATNSAAEHSRALHSIQEEALWSYIEHPYTCGTRNSTYTCTYSCTYRSKFCQVPERALNHPERGPVGCCSSSPQCVIPA